MREILFRGIPKDDTTRHFFADIWKDDCDGSFVYGSLIISKDRYYICVSALCQINSCINNGMTSMIEVIPETVGQHTGLSDKNGKKVFEGDIIKTVTNSFDRDEFITEIKFGARRGVQGFYLANGRMMFYFGQKDLTVMDDTEVIGNIHDNPELLKGGEG